MSAAGMTVTAQAAEVRPDYGRLAWALLDRARAFYQDPENETAYQEWKAGKEERNGQREKAG